jgi:hypothetical protein
LEYFEVNGNTAPVNFIVRKKDGSQQDKDLTNLKDAGVIKLTATCKYGRVTKANIKFSLAWTKNKQGITGEPAINF